MRKLLKDDELFRQILMRRKQEKDLLTEILHDLREVDERKLYLKHATGSLFDFCVRVLGYDESAAYRRINAMRAIRTVPEVEKKLESGELTLTTINQVQNYIRSQTKERKVPQSEKKKLFELASGKTKRELERALLSLSPEKVECSERVRALTSTQSEIRMAVSDRWLNKLERLKELYFRKNPNATQAEVLEWVMDLTLAKLDPAEQKVRARKSAAPKFGTRYVPAVTRREVWKRNKIGCEIRDPKSGRVCGSRVALEIDHVLPFGVGGTSELENLRLVCRAHNHWLAQQTFGEKVPSMAPE